jgi:hypothetical protein
MAAADAIPGKTARNYERSTEHPCEERAISIPAVTRGEGVSGRPSALIAARLTGSMDRS